MANDRSCEINSYRYTLSLPFPRFPTYVVVTHQRHRRRDGRTDGMQSQSRALCTRPIVHRAVKMAKMRNGPPAHVSVVQHDAI